MSESLTVVIADDHAIFRQALRLTLMHRSRGVTVVGEAENGEQVIEQVAKQQPDILILDLALPKRSTKEVLNAVRASSPTTRVVILTGFADTESVEMTARGGAKAFVLKSGPLESLVDAIAAVSRGEVWADPNLTVTCHQEFLRIAGGGDRGLERSLRALSPREIEVLELIAEGLSNRDVAARLSISDKTVISHLNRVFEKLGVENRLQAAILYNNLSRGSRS